MNFTLFYYLNLTVKRKNCFPKLYPKKEQAFSADSYLYTAMREKIYYLFVYGSLRKGFHNEAYQYISNYFHFVGDATVKGLLYDLGPYPAAVPANGDSKIIGELYEIKNKDEYGYALAQLDDYEGVDPLEGETQYYRREAVEVSISDHTIRSWIYWYNQPVEGYPLIASGDVLQYMRDKVKKEVNEH